MTAPQEQPRSEDWIREREARRADLHTRAVQGLFILNGGGAIALLTFISQSWDRSPEIVGHAAWGLLIMTAGLLFAAPINLVRYKSSRLHDRAATRNQGQFYGRLWRCMFAASLGAFAVAVLIVAVGVLTGLPT